MLGDAIRTRLPALQAQAESLMDTQCVVQRKTGESHFDPDTNEYEDVWATIYAGKCRLAPPPPVLQQAVHLGEQRVTVQQYTVMLPYGTTGVQVSDLLTITAAPNPDQVGRTLAVTSVRAATQTVATRLVVSDDLG